MKIFLLLAGLFVSLFRAGAQQPVIEEHLNLEGGLALQGYDPVAYFLQERAVKGKKEFSLTEGKSVYYFASPDNRELFRKSPERYKPQYGGWCAYAMGDSGEKVTVDPETFKIVNGKLYLFYNRFFTNTLTKWNADEKNLHRKADQNWNKLLSRK